MKQDYDGTIRIDTKLDSDGLNKGAAEASTKLTGIGKAVQGIGKGLATVGKIAAVGLVAVFVAAVAAVALLVRAIFAIGKATLFAAKKALEYSQQVDEVKQTFARLKSALMDAFRPLVYFALPWINQVANSLIKILEMVAHVTAYITGQTGYWRTVTENIENAGDAAKGSLASFDKLNVLQQDQQATEPEQEWVEIGEELPDFLEGGWAAFVEGLRDVLLEGDWSVLETWFQDYVWNPIVNSVGLEDGSSLKALLLNFVDPRKLFDGDPNKPWGDWWKDQLDPRNWFAPTEGSKVGEIIDGIWDAIWTGILEWKWDDLGTLIFDGIFGEDAWKWLTDEEYFKNWASEHSNGIAAAVAVLIGVFINPFLGMAALIVGALIANWDDISLWWEGKKTEWEGMGLSVWQGILKGIQDAAADIINWVREHVFQPIVNAIKSLFGISSPSTVMAEIGGDLIAGLLQGIAVAWSNITTWFQNTIFNPLKAWFADAWNNIKIGATTAWENIKLVWNVVTGWFQTTIVDPIKEKFNTFWTDIKQIFTDLWEDIKVIWNVVAEWFQTTIIDPIKTKFGTMWTDVKQIFTDLWTDIKGIWDDVSNWFQTSVIDPVKTKFDAFKLSVKKIFEDLWTDIKNVWQNVGDWFKDNVVNPVIRFLNGMIGALESAVNWLINALNMFSFDIPSWLGGGTFGFNFSPIYLDRIPELAKGAVIPPNSEFLAILGDQKSGRNIEAPEDLLRQIVREEMKGSSKSEPVLLHNVLKVDGKVIYESWNKENVRRGNSLVAKGAVL